MITPLISTNSNITTFGNATIADRLKKGPYDIMKIAVSIVVFFIILSILFPDTKEE